MVEIITDGNTSEESNQDQTVSTSCVTDNARDVRKSRLSI